MLGRMDALAQHKGRAYGGAPSAEEMLHPHSQEQMKAARNVRGNYFAPQAAPQPITPQTKKEDLKDGHLYIIRGKVYKWDAKTQRLEDQ